VESPVGIGYSGAFLVFGAGLLTLWLLLPDRGLRELLSRAITNLSGHLGAPPEPWLECALREAFVKFDLELAAILRDRENPPDRGTRVVDG
jgi:hypothetical protein